MLEVTNISKQYPTPRGPLTVLSDVTLSLAPGDAVAIMGPSGSGKSSLLYILGGLEPPSAGCVSLGGRSLYAFERPRGAHTERRVNDSYGLLLLTLRDAGYAWRFVPAAGSTLVDAGTASCH